ncbi:MAG: energy transducer TonB [Bacteroidales bacterium]|jgi:TonB family protein|nr:energy transducer TonB [Bacteroidales bacterium]
MKRLKVKGKKVNGSLAYVLGIIFCASSLFYSCASYRNAIYNEDYMFSYGAWLNEGGYANPTNLDKPIQFPGGDEAFMHYIKDSIPYPEEAQKKGFEDLVPVSFVIREDGSVSNIRVKSLDVACARNVRLAIGRMPKWEPGTINGEPAPVGLAMFVKFSVRKDSATVTLVHNQDVYKKAAQIYDCIDCARRADIPARFPGGNKAYQQFLVRTMEYPIIARESGTQGYVYITLIVERDGSLSNVKVVRGIGDGCDNEAVRLFESMPKWIPAKHNGEAVRVQYMAALKFTLEG